METVLLNPATQVARHVMDLLRTNVFPAKILQFWSMALVSARTIITWIQMDNVLAATFNVQLASVQTTTTATAADQMQS